MGPFGIILWVGVGGLIGWYANRRAERHDRYNLMTDSGDLSRPLTFTPTKIKFPTFLTRSINVLHKKVPEKVDTLLPDFLRQSRTEEPIHSTPLPAHVMEDDESPGYYVYNDGQIAEHPEYQFPSPPREPDERELQETVIHPLRE